MAATMKRMVYLFAGVMILSLAACNLPFNRPTTGATDAQATQAVDTPTLTSAAPVSLANTQWQLASFGEPGAETPAIADAAPTLKFEEGNRAGGSGGCNSFGAQYSLQDGKITFSQIVSTQMACTASGVMEQERNYFQALQSAGQYELAGDHLTIHYNNGAGALNFVGANSLATQTQTPASNLLCAATGLGAQPGWNTCRSQQYGFEVGYPPAAELVDQTPTSARIDLPFTPGTNLDEKYLQIDVTENAATCSSPLSQGYAPGTFQKEPVQVNGMEFIKESGQDAGAGNIYNWTAYSISRQGLCVSLGFVLHSHQPELEPTPPPEYNAQAESQIFEEIAASFEWLGAAGGGAATQTPTATATATAEPTSTSEPLAVQTTQSPVHIHFQSGATSATLSGHLAASASDLYVLRALGGQTMTVDLSFTRGRAILAVWGADGTVLLSDHAEASHFQDLLPSTQDYYILLEGRPEGSTDYSMQVTIPPLTGGSPTPVPQRIHFQSGAISATLSGHLAASESDLYVLRALGGQTMTVDLSFTRGRAILAVWGADGAVLLSDHAEASHFQDLLPSTQDYYILLEGRPEGSTDYSMQVTIPPAIGTQPTVPERIRFQTGATSATLSGHLAASASDLYVLRALQGQTMTVDLTFTSGRAILAVWGADGIVLLSDHAEASHFQGALPSTQDYYILLKGRPDGSTDYSMKVTIPPG